MGGLQECCLKNNIIMRMFLRIKDRENGEVESVSVSPGVYTE